MNYVVKGGIFIFIFFFALLVTTKLGVPYEYSEEHPRLRRIIALVRFNPFFPLKNNGF